MLLVLYGPRQRDTKWVNDLLKFGPTLSPMHLMVPTSFCASGDKMRWMDSTFPVSDPGCKTEVPEKMETSTCLPARSALPTSISC